MIRPRAPAAQPRPLGDRVARDAERGLRPACDARVGLGLILLAGLANGAELVLRGERFDRVDDDLAGLSASFRAAS